MNGAGVVPPAPANNRGCMFEVGMSINEQCQGAVPSSAPANDLCCMFEARMSTDERCGVVAPPLPSAVHDMQGADA